MKNRLEQKERVRQDVCPTCGRRVMQPCLACQMEELHALRLVKHEDSPGSTDEDLSVHLADVEQQRRYEEVRNFRDTHGYPKWSAQWREQKQHTAGQDQNISRQRSLDCLRFV